MTGYVQILKRLLLLLIFIGIVFIVSFFIVYPLWYFSINYSNLFTFSVLLVISLFFISLLIKKIVRFIRRKTSEGKGKIELLTFIRKTIIRLFFLSICFASLYLTIILILMKNYPATVPALILLLTLSGFFFFTGKRGNN